MPDRGNTVMKRYTLIKELCDSDYVALLEFALRNGLVLLLVDPCGFKVVERDAFLEKMSPFQVSCQEESSWPGTKLLGHTARVYKYVLTNESITVLLGVSSRLYQWVQPKLLEDMCFLRKDNSVFMTSTTHEKDTYFDLNAAEYESLITEVADIQLKAEI